MWIHLYLKMDSLIKCFLFSNVFLFLGHWWRTGGDWDECWSKKRMSFPLNWCNSGFKGGRCPGWCRRCHMLCWWGFFMTTSVMLKRSWKLTVMHDLYSWTETNCKCIICKNKMLNACSVLFSKRVYTLSFIHMLTFFHTRMRLLNVIISVLMLWFINVQSCQNSL